MWHIWLPGPWASHQSGLGLGCDHRSGSLHLPIWKSGIVLNILSECDTTYFVNYHLILVTGPSTDRHMKWRQKNYKVKIIKKLNPHQTTALELFTCNAPKRPLEHDWSIPLGLQTDWTRRRIVAMERALWIFQSFDPRRQILHSYADICFISNSESCFTKLHEIFFNEN